MSLSTIRWDQPTLVAASFGSRAQHATRRAIRFRPARSRRHNHSTKANKTVAGLPARSRDETPLPDGDVFSSRAHAYESVQALPPCVLFEDENILVVNKPPGWNTHAPSPLASEGIYDWLRNQQPRWANLSLLQRLDKETSGCIVFGKTTVANRSLQAQFEARQVSKQYLFYTSARGGSPLGPLRPEAARRRAVVEEQAGGWLRVTSLIARAGDVYCSSAEGEGDEAVTLLRCAADGAQGGPYTVEARPLTGRTHQIRLHAASLGAPIDGDGLYGGAPAPRMWLHAHRLRFSPPSAAGAEKAEEVEFEAPMEAGGGDWWRRWTVWRGACGGGTDCFRLAHGAAASREPFPGAGAVYAERLGPALLLAGEAVGEGEGPAWARSWGAVAAGLGCSAVFAKRLRRDVAVAGAEEAAPRLVWGAAPAADAAGRFCVREHGLAYLLSLAEGYSAGLFLDQRENRRRLLAGYVAPAFGPLWPSGRFGAGAAEGATMLNCFAFTCGFSVAAAAAGAATLSLDLSKRYLEWGRANMRANGLAGAGDDYVFGDCFEWLRRLAAKGRVFDVVVLDPPTFSRGGGPLPGKAFWRAEQDWGALAALAMRVLVPGGVLLASTNAARLPPEVFIEQVLGAALAERRPVLAQHFAPAPPDFPASREDPAYLKTLWLRLGPAAAAAAEGEGGMRRQLPAAVPPAPAPAEPIGRSGMGRGGEVRRGGGSGGRGRGRGRGRGGGATGRTPPAAPRTLPY